MEKIKVLVRIRPFLQNENSANKIFVLDYKDDLISLICYRMLKNLQQVCPFKF